MSSESSEEDEINKFREAVDTRFLTEDLYKSSESEERHESPPKPPPSLRNISHDTDSFNPFSIKVTPEFQKHVSQHLSRLLDESIDDTKPILKWRKFKQHKGNHVKLLYTSKDYVCFPPPLIVNKPRKNVSKDSESPDYEKRAKEVAVSAEWVLSQKEMEHWVPNTRGEVEVVKLCGPKKKRKKP